MKPRTISVRIEYRLSPAGQMKELLAGRDCQALRSKKLPIEPWKVEHFGLEIDALGWLQHPALVGFDSDPTSEEILATLEAIHPLPLSMLCEQSTPEQVSSGSGSSCISNTQEQVDITEHNPSKTRLLWKSLTWPRQS